MDKNSSHFRARLYLGEALLELGQVAEAVTELELAYKMDQDEASLAWSRALVSQAQLQLQAGDEEGALFACGRALQISPNDQKAQEIKAGIWTRRGDAELGQGHLDEALVAYLQADARQMVEEVEKRKLWRPGQIIDDKYRIIKDPVITASCEYLSCSGKPISS